MDRGDSHMGVGAVQSWARHGASRSASLGSGKPAPAQRGCGDVRSPVGMCLQVPAVQQVRGEP